MVIGRDFLLISCATMLNAAAGATLLPIRVDSQHVPGFVNPALAGAIAADFEGIGRDDVAVTGMQISGWSSGVLPGAAQSGFVAILHFDTQSQTYSIVQTLITDDSALAGIALDPASNAGPGLVVVSQAGTLSRYSGWPLQLVSHVPLNQYVSGMQVGDVDGDGHPEVVVTHPSSGAAAYDLVTGALQRTYAGRFGKSLALAQLDADPALEIILSGTPGYVIDGATNATDWEYAGGIGDVLAAGTLSAGGGQGFVGADSRYLSAFRSTPYSPIWSLDGGYAAVDFVEIDGSQHLLLGRGYGEGMLDVLDPVTQAVQASFVADPIGHIAAGHLEGGSAVQLVSSSGLETTASDSLVVNGLDGSLRFALSDEDGPFVVAAPGDIDGDGRADGVWASYFSDSGYDGGYIHVYDLASGAERSRARLTDAAGNELWFRAISALTLIPATGRSNVVAAAENFYTAELYLIDGQTQRIIASNTTTPFAQQRPIHQLVTLGDDVLAAASGTGIELARFSGADLHAMWHQTLSDAYGSTVNSLTPASLAGASSHDALLATSNALLAYDLDAQSVLWSMTTSTAAAALLTHADGTTVVGALGNDGHLRLLSLDGSTALGDILVGMNEAQALAPVPNMPGIALVCIDRHIAAVDIDAGSVLQQSPWIGGLACAGGNIAVAPASAGPSHVVAGSIVGAFDLTLTTDAIFGDGFDGYSTTAR